jgi:hypothetical protein
MHNLRFEISNLKLPAVISKESRRANRPFCPAWHRFITFFAKQSQFVGCSNECKLIYNKGLQKKRRFCSPKKQSQFKPNLKTDDRKQTSDNRHQEVTQIAVVSQKAGKQGFFVISGRNSGKTTKF